MSAVYSGHEIYMVRINEVKGTKHKGIMTQIREEEVNLHVMAFACFLFTPTCVKTTLKSF